MFTKIRCVIASITLAAISAGAEEPLKFHAQDAAAYAHQAVSNVTIGAKAFDTQAQTVEAFGKKADLLKYGILPVLVVLENKRDRAIDIQNIQVELMASDGRHGQPLQPEEVMMIPDSGKKPPKIGGGGPLPIPLPKKKNPFNGPEIVERHFSARVVPANDSVSGFFYFQAKAEPGDSLYVSGIRDARTGQELLYFEFPLNPK